MNFPPIFKPILIPVGVTLIVAFIAGLVAVVRHFFGQDGVDLLTLSGVVSALLLFWGVVAFVNEINPVGEPLE